ncbi:MAG: hypothetical protein IPI18_19620 [Saprospiraceae bacterium]|nr:hypothetical protein [Saprospiraceae bacterium]
MKHEQNKNIPDPTLNKEEKKTPGYPPYPADQDIYFNAKKKASIKPDDISKTKPQTRVQVLVQEMKGF